MTVYKLKDKKYQERLDALSDVNGFSEQFIAACNKYIDSNSNYVPVKFGKQETYDPDRIHGLSVTSLKSEIEIANPDEKLQPNVWYEREKFNGNPDGYTLVEYFQEEDEDSFYDITEDDTAKTWIRSDTKKFMYLEKPE